MRNNNVAPRGNVPLKGVRKVCSFQAEKCADFRRKKHPGYTEDEIKGMALGFFPPQKDVKAHLVSKGYSVDSVNRAGLRTGGFGTMYTLAIPYRDPVGGLRGFIVRATDPGVDPKYKFSAGMEKETLFNLQEARAELGSGRGFPGRSRSYSPRSAGSSRYRRECSHRLTARDGPPLRRAELCPCP
jgi:hypothetical protein